MSFKQLPIEAKVVILGAQGVGKTSIALRHIGKTFSGKVKPTISASFFTFTLDVEKNTKVKIQLWDTAGQERFRSLVSMYYRKATAAIIVYDITDLQSFEDAKEWVEELHNNVGTNVVLYIVGNKCDLQEQRKVPMETLEEYARSLQVLYGETSAAHDIGIQDIFTLIVENIVRLHRNEPLTSSQHAAHGKSLPITPVSSIRVNETIKLDNVDNKTVQPGPSPDTENKKKKKCCCGR
ncbi:ras-related protein Rab-31-like isoform X1 [Dysidea avara]|uniref:ras-related protein Rab-31-like isoform X1 n=1 Tax=Dysidea avara TaxID=196820 RepID=UPI00332A16F1